MVDMDHMVQEQRLGTHHHKPVQVGIHSHKPVQVGMCIRRHKQVRAEVDIRHKQVQVGVDMHPQPHEQVVQVQLDKPSVPVEDLDQRKFQRWKDSMEMEDEMFL